MSEINELIERYGPSFCVQPWKHLHITDSGLCKFCCLTPPLRDSKGKALSVNELPLEQIWNSDSLRKIRQSMVAGNTVQECNLCIAREKAGGLSRRLRENKLWENGYIAKNGMSLADLKTAALCSDFIIEYSPFSLQFEVDNICNLACRMCSSDRSSRVENDLVHGQWIRHKFIIPKWKNNTLQIGPDRLLSVKYSGFIECLEHKKNETLLTSKKSDIYLENLNTFLHSLEIKFSPESKERSVRIFANNTIIYANTDGQLLPQNIIVDLNAHYAELTLSFESNTEYSAQNNALVGIGIESISIKRDKKTTPPTELLSSRFLGKQHWMQDDEFLFCELLGDNAQLRSIMFSGGEPLINHFVQRVIKHLIISGDQSNLSISLATNGTIYNKKIFELANKFKLMTIAVSIDDINNGAGYIRYGTNIEVVKKNIILISSLKNIHIGVSSTIQPYNVLDFSNVLRFCDEHKLLNQSNFVVAPSYTSICVLPPSVRKIAAKRIANYAKEAGGLDYNKQGASIIARRLDSNEFPFNPLMLREFMLFTNDLDQSRGQNIHETYPELVRLIEKAGYPWINETFYCNIPESKPNLIFSKIKSLFSFTFPRGKF